jgi:hypothetical protein
MSGRKSVSKDIRDGEGRRNDWKVFLLEGVHRFVVSTRKGKLLRLICKTERLHGLKFETSVFS